MMPAGLMQADDAAFRSLWFAMPQADKDSLPDDVRRSCVDRYRHLTPYIDKSIDRAERTARQDRNAPVLTLPPLVALEIGELLKRDFPLKEPLLSPWLRRQDLVMVHAWRGVGKTHFAMNVAYAVAGGGSFLGWKADKPRRVLYIDGEMPGATIKERAAGLVANSDESAEPPEDYFRIVTPDVQDTFIPDLATPEGQAAIADVLGKL